MKKFNVILDDTTVLNFPFIFKLLKRYYLGTLLIPIIILSVTMYFYVKQNDIYMITVGFKAVKNESDSPTGAIASLLGEKTSGLTSAEIIVMARSIDFYQQLAERVFEHPDFRKMDFNDIKTKQKLTQDQMFGGCGGHRGCIVNVLRSKISRLYTIKEDNTSNRKFFIVVKTLDKVTSRILLNTVSETMQANRLAEIRHFISAQRDITQDLIEKKRKELNFANYNDLIRKREEILNKIRSISNQAGAYSQSHHAQKMELEYAKIKFDQTKSAVKSKKFDNLTKARVKEVKKISRRMASLRQDLNILERSKEDLSSEDKSVIMQIKNELAEHRNRLKKIGFKDRDMNNISRFVDRKDRDTDFSEFDYKVIKDQYDKTQKHYKKLLKAKEKLLSEDLDVKTQLEKISPSIEYLKLLENKTVQLKLLEATVISDFVFDKNNSAMSRYKRMSKAKSVFFGIFLSAFALFVFLVLRYTLDNRIYDEFEMKMNFQDMEIIGKTPDYH